MCGPLVRKKSITGYLTHKAIAGIVGFIERHGVMMARGEGEQNGSCRFMGTEFQL